MCFFWLVCSFISPPHHHRRPASTGPPAPALFGGRHLGAEKGRYCTGSPRPPMCLLSLPPSAFVCSSLRIRLPSLCVCCVPIPRIPYTLLSPLFPSLLQKKSGCAPQCWGGPVVRYPSPVCNKDTAPSQAVAPRTNAPAVAPRTNAPAPAGNADFSTKEGEKRQGRVSICVCNGGASVAASGPRRPSASPTAAHLAAAAAAGAARCCRSTRPKASPTRQPQPMTSYQKSLSPAFFFCGAGAAARAGACSVEGQHWARR